MFANVFGLFSHPKSQWQAVAKRGGYPVPLALLYVLVLAAIPALAWYRGTTMVGWTVGDDGDVVRMARDSALVIIALFYVTMVAAICIIGYMIHWMSQTYGADSSVAKGITIAALTATPLFIAGAIGFFPVFTLALLVGLIALCYAVYLLYAGIPIVMGIPEERGFLFASAVIAVCMVIFMAIMGGSVILWDMGATPRFVD